MNVRLIRWPDREPIFFHAFRVQFMLEAPESIGDKERNGTIDDWVSVTTDFDTAERLVCFVQEAPGARAGISDVVNSEDVQFPGNVCVVLVKYGVGMLSVMDADVNGVPTTF